MSAFSGSAADVIGVLQRNVGTASSTPLAGTAADMKNVGKALVTFMLGDMASETIDCVVQACDSGGANPVTLKAATQLAANASANDSKIIVVGVENNEVTAAGKRFIRGIITTGGVTGGTCTILVQGTEFRNGPASANDVADVVQVVA